MINPPPTKSLIMVGNFLSRRGYTRQYIEDMADLLQNAGWKVIRTSSVVFRPFRLINMVFDLVSNKNQYTVGHIAVFSGLAFIWAEVACCIMKLLRKPCVMLLHGGNLPVFARRWPARVRRLFNSAKFVVAPSQYLLEGMKPYRSDLKFLPNCVDISNYSFRSRLSPRPSLVWLRAFHKIYNPQMAPAVLFELIQHFPEINLTMIGPDKGDGTFQATQKRIEELGLQERIEIIPGIPKIQVPDLLSKADILINTTHVDNTPVSVLEAMACGLCIVSTNVGGIPYLLTDGEDALLVPPDDPKAMAIAVSRILTEPGLAEKLSRNARRKAEGFDWSIVLPQWESLFLEAINQKENGRKKL